eukprot:1795968-Alexandrium_andersonii.AAC.1
MPWWDPSPSTLRLPSGREVQDWFPIWFELPSSPTVEVQVLARSMGLGAILDAPVGNPCLQRPGAVD